MPYNYNLEFLDNDKIIEYINSLKDKIFFQDEVKDAINFYFLHEVFPTFETNEKTNLFTKYYFYKEINKIFLDKDILNILCLDIINFKSFNNSYGYHFGDKLIKILSENLQDLYDKKDIYYFGSDKFLIKLKNIKDFKIPMIEIKDKNICLPFKYSLISIIIKDSTKEYKEKYNNYFQNLIKTILEKSFIESKKDGVEQIYNLKKIMLEIQES